MFVSAPRRFGPLADFFYFKSVRYNNLMAQKLRGASWIDIINPTDKDLTWLYRKFKLHPVILDELKEPSARASVEVFKNYIYLIYYFPAYEHGEETSRKAEIDFIITPQSVVTVHYEEIEPLKNFAEKSAEDSLMLVYRIIEAILKFQERQLRHIGEATENIGRELFKEKERDVLRQLSRLKRNVSEYRIIVRYQGHLLKSLLTKGSIFWGAEEKPYLNDLVGDHLKVMNQVDDYREAISDFEDTNNQLMNMKINEVMRTFTTLSFLTFPFVLIAAIFGMNTTDTPLTGQPHGFWIIFASMATAMVVLVIYFKKRGWI